MGQSAIGPPPQLHSSDLPELRRTNSDVPVEKARLAKVAHNSELPDKEERTQQPKSPHKSTVEDFQPGRRRSFSHSGAWPSSPIQSPLGSPKHQGVDLPDYPAAAVVDATPPANSEKETVDPDNTPPPRRKTPTRAIVRGRDDLQIMVASRELELCRSHSTGDLSQIVVERKTVLQVESKRNTPPMLLKKDILMEMINSRADISALNEEGDSVIHSILWGRRKDKLELLLTLLINSEIDVNCQNSKGDTALHIAIQKEDVRCIKALIVFGADINKLNSKGLTPYEMVTRNGRLFKVANLLIKLGAKQSAQLVNQTAVSRVPRMHAFAENMRPLKSQSKLTPNVKLSDFIKKQGTRQLHKELQALINQRRSFYEADENENFAIHEQEKELLKYNKTQQLGGSRILCLDGGGIKGLIQLEILLQIEEATGRTVVELFDWIVGTSTGGVIALALVYGKKSLRSLRQLYFKLKDRVFANSRYGFGYDSKALDEVLKEYLDPDIKMTDVSHPKVLVAAVNKATTNLELHFFNNCFGDEYCHYPVWKVARYTSAAPLFFTEVDKYVDGGLICNNPTEYGLTAIQNFCRKQEIELPISVVVSVGSGQNPAKPMGMVDAHEALFFGKQWLRPDKLINMTQNLFELLSNALVESEMVATNSECRCRGQNIPFFRFSPKLDEIITAGETDNDKLFSMILKTKTDTRNGQLSELKQLFHQIATQQQRIKADLSRSQSVVLPYHSPVLPKRPLAKHSSVPPSHEPSKQVHTTTNKPADKQVNGDTHLSSPTMCNGEHVAGK